MRQSFIELPSGKELQTILAEENKHTRVPANAHEHYADMSAMHALLSEAGITSAMFTTNLSIEKVITTDILQQTMAKLNALARKILSGGINTDTLNSAYEYLSEEDQPATETDIIFVFGAKTPLRIQQAIKVYQTIPNAKLFISGKNPVYASNNQMEAENYKQVAITAGVPVKQIITETESITIPDNVRSSLNLMDKLNLHPNSIMLINSPYSQRRGYAHFKKYISPKIKLIRVNCATGAEYTKSNWYKNVNGIKVVLNEFVKMKIGLMTNTL